MSAPLQDTNREVIPRWRDVRSTILLGELTPSKSETPVVTPSSDFLEDKVRDWETEKSLPFATEVVGAALVLGRVSEARSAAEYIIAQRAAASQIAVELATRVLEERPERLTLPTTARESLSASVREMRSLIRTDPRNAFAWVELARTYATLGLLPRAAKAMNTGLMLGGNNRYVLRAAARLYTHLGDPAHAHRILVRSEATPSDPWLIAAEIATASLCDRTPRFVREGIKLLDSKQLAPFDLSEMASAIATLDSKAGSHRRARKHFRLSLQQPNDNAVAQARWAATHKFIDIDVPTILAVPRAFEAQSWYEFYAAQWKASLKSAKRWLRDQPFSVSPAVHASYVASVALQDYAEGVAIAEAGLMANPKDVMLLNNLSYSLANLGDLEKSKSILDRIQKNELAPQNGVVVNATMGLIAYRSGKPEVGRDFYNAAMIAAEKCRDKRLHAKAALFFALEELRSQSDTAIQAATQAMKLNSEFQDVDFDLLRDRLNEAIAEYRARGTVTLASENKLG